MICSNEQNLCAIIILKLFAFLCLYSALQSDAYHKAAHLNSGGIEGYILLSQRNVNVLVEFGYTIQSCNKSKFARWEIHELPVDITIDPKFRCRSEFVGDELHSGGNNDYIFNVSINSLILRAMVLVINNSTAACGTIGIEYRTYISGNVDFRSGVFGQLQFINYSAYTGENNIYVVGSMQEERKCSWGSKEMTSSYKIILHNDTYPLNRSYDTVDYVCNGSGRGTPILNIQVNNSWLNVSFSKLIPQYLNVSAYMGHVISIQNCNETILGCGRLENHFSVYASYHDTIVLRQHSPYHRTHRVGWTLEQMNIFEYSVLDIIGNRCSHNESADIFDPWKPPPDKVGCQNTTDQFAVGDLFNRQKYGYYLDAPLIGSSTILGHATNDSQCNSSLELAVPELCGNLYLSMDTGHTLTGYAELAGSILTGKITFTQGVLMPEWVLGPTIITVDLSYTDTKQNATDGHGWCIRIDQGHTNTTQTCTEIGYMELYNPYKVNTKPSSCYMDDCTSHRQQRCAMGDLSGKLGRLKIDPNSIYPHKTYSFYDENLFLTGPYTIFGHFIVVFDASKDDQILDCTRILPMRFEMMNISFRYNDANRIVMGKSLSLSAGITVGDVLVLNTERYEVNGVGCLIANLWITGLNDANITKNAEAVRHLNNLPTGTYARRPCVDDSRPVPFKELAIAALVIIIILSIVICGVLLKFRRKQRINIYAVEGQQGMRQFSPALVSLLPSKGDRWEMSRSQFSVGAKLGEGHYGEVYKGTLSVDIAMTPAKIYIARQTLNGKPPYTVAIKLLKGGVEGRDMQNFLEEIAMMKKVSSGKCCYVVQMVGCVSTALPLALTLEFVPFGDLLSYLKHWRQKSNAEAMPTLSEDSPLDYDKLHPQGGEEVGLEPAVEMERRGTPGASTGEVFEMTAVLEQKSKDDISGARKNDEQSLSYAMLYSATTEFQEGSYSPLGEPDLEDLPSFAYQIAQGMEYLSSLGVLHRDLACRNILVDEGKVLKISDFGLSRDTPEYVSSLQDKMPLRWMAPETVTENIFTDKSDVWSFGVCLWEMYTLGAIPYEDLPMATLLAQIISGYRLPMPELASDKIYQLMLICWSSEPQARLNFTQLKYFFKSTIIAENKGANYINIEP